MSKLALGYTFSQDDPHQSPMYPLIDWLERKVRNPNFHEMTLALALKVLVSTSHIIFTAL